MGQSPSVPLLVDTSAVEDAYNKQTSRDLALADLTFVRRRAEELAIARSQMNWEMVGGMTTFSVLFFSGLALKRKVIRQEVFIPMVPIIMYLGVRYDHSYGAALDNIRTEAEKLLEKGDSRLARIGGPITLKEIDDIRAKWRQN